MKLKLLCSIAVVSSACLLSACSPTDMQAITGDGTAISSSDIKRSPTNPNKVKLYFGNQGIPKHYRVIGRVSADNYSIIATPHTQEFIADQLKKQAASIGGVGVININSALDKTTGDAIVTR